MIERVRVTCLAIFLILLTAAPLTAQKSADLPTDTIRKIEEVVESEQTAQKIPGLSVAIAVDNKLRYSKGFGMSDLENSVPAKAVTAYRTASIAKSMTATAVMQLVEQGKIDLDAPIQKYCPAFPEKKWPVTARQLLGHLSGIRHYEKPGEASGTEHFKNIEDSLAIFKDDPLQHEPGAKFTYTTYGYSVLGCAIEGASGMSYDKYLTEHLFKPAGMDRTRTDDHFAIIPDRARGYWKRFGIIVANATLHDTSMKIPGGGLVSTAEDLVRFAIAMNTGALVKKKTLEQMWTRQKTLDGKETSYGLGWGVNESGGRKVVSHSGGQAGTSTLLILIPERGMTIALMSNMQGASLGNIARQITNALVSMKN